MAQRDTTLQKNITLFSYSDPEGTLDKIKKIQTLICVKKAAKIPFYQTKHNPPEHNLHA